MGNVLAFCEVENGKLKSNALANIAFARTAAEQHGGDVIALLISGKIGDAGSEAAKYAAKVVTVEDGGLEKYMAETYAPILARIAKEQGAAVVSATASTTGKDLLPRAAFLLEAGMASDISEAVTKNQFKRPILAGNAFSTIEISTDPICVSVRQSAFEPAEPLESAGEVMTAEAGELDALGAEVIKVETVESDRPDLNDADVVVAGGRGLGKDKTNPDATPEQNFEALGQLADLLNAGMGASRAVTDAGWVPADWQVGQTGKIVAPNLYFAFAISGAIQHLAGMKGSKTIVAVNKDPEAPIFQVADYGLVTTWEEALPDMIEEIKKAKEA